MRHASSSRLLVSRAGGCLAVRPSGRSGPAGLAAVPGCLAGCCWCTAMLDAPAAPAPARLPGWPPAWLAGGWLAAPAPAPATSLLTAAWPAAARDPPARKTSKSPKGQQPQRATSEAPGRHVAATAAARRAAVAACRHLTLGGRACAACSSAVATLPQQPGSILISRC
jgi:hypothetical protein